MSDMNESFDLIDVDRLTVGTVGPVGQRVFLLQARAGGELVTVKMEKQQVSALAQYLGQVLAELPRPGDLPDDLELEDPSEARWVVGVMGVTYDEPTDRVVLVAQEAVAMANPEEIGGDIGEEIDEEDGAVLRITATREQVAALAIRGTALVEAGRPACPLCGYPLDPSEHVCPRTNGHRAPTL
jgi:uncharacterized repeat protein (TIGR03847 family)